MYTYTKLFCHKLVVQIEIKKNSNLKFYVFIQIRFAVDANEYYVQTWQNKFVMQNNLVGNNINIRKLDLIF